MKKILNYVLLTTLMCFSAFPLFAQEGLSLAEIDARNRVEEPMDGLMMLSMENRDDAYVTVDILEIASEQTTVDGQPAYFAKSPFATAFGEFPHEIEYFNYEPGYEYSLKIQTVDYKKGKRANEYELLQVIRKEKMDSDLRQNHEMETFGQTYWKMAEFLGKPSGGSMQINDSKVYFGTGCNGISGTK
ncbi:MAG: DUF4377 domain-containing protein, partial [Bacteroidota bacterium]